MRYKNYLNEENYNPHAKQAMLGVQTVYTHCMPCINDLVKGGYSYLKKADDLMYSGRDSGQSILSKKVRTDRKPTDMEMDRHNILNDLFYKKFKTYARSNSIFCSGNLMTAGAYGSNVFIIFPAGQYQLLWSDKIKDLYNGALSDNLFDKYQKDYLKYREDILMKTKSEDLDKVLKSLPTDIYSGDNKIKKDLIKSLNKDVLTTYRKGDIMGAIDSKNEIMLTCKYYIGLKHIDYNRVIKQYIDQNGTKFPDKEFFFEWYERYIE